MMLLCGWPKRKRKPSTLQDRCDLNVSIDDGKHINETDIPANIIEKSIDCTALQHFNQSMRSLVLLLFILWK